MLEIMIVNMLNSTSTSTSTSSANSAPHILKISDGINKPLEEIGTQTIADILSGQGIQSIQDETVVGIYGKRYDLNTSLKLIVEDLIYPHEFNAKNLDALKMPIRIEIYAPLIADPMQQRRNKDKAKTKSEKQNNNK